MRLGHIRQRHITQQWMNFSIRGGMEYINGCGFMYPIDNCQTSMVATHQCSRFSSKDSSNKLIATTIMTTKNNDGGIPPGQPSNISSLSQSGSDQKPDVFNNMKKPQHLPKTNAPINEDVNQLDMKRSQETRRLIVKRSSMNDVDAVTIIKSPLHRRQRVGIVNRRFPLEREIADSGGKTIWIPVKTFVNNHRMAETNLPQIDASAWLDPSAYCRGGGKTIAGTAAARQLLHGKKDLFEVLGHAVYSSTSKLVQRHRSIVLRGHGVPPQLLQHHIDSADKLLLHVNASEISFKQFNVSNNDILTATTDEVRNIRYGQVRDAETGENRVIPWPIDNVTEWDHNLHLYWAVMNRIATRLGLPVLLKQPQVTQSKPETSSRRPRGDNHVPLILNNSMLNVPPHCWRVKFSRDLYFSPDQLPTMRSHLYPVIEWTPLEGVASPGHVCIRLQGQSARGNGDFPISLFFDASFRSNYSESNDTF